MRELHGLLAGVAQSVKRPDAGQHVEEDAQRHLERQPLAGAPEPRELLAVEEVAEHDEVVSAHRDLAHASDVRTRQRGDASRLAPQVGASAAVTRPAGPREALGDGELRAADGERRLARDVEGDRARAELTDHFVRSEQVCVDREASVRSDHVTKVPRKRSARHRGLMSRRAKRAPWASCRGGVCLALARSPSAPSDEDPRAGTPAARARRGGRSCASMMLAAIVFCDEHDPHVARELGEHLAADAARRAGAGPRSRRRTRPDRGRRRPPWPRWRSARRTASRRRSRSRRCSPRRCRPPR